MAVENKIKRKGLAERIKEAATDSLIGQGGQKNNISKKIVVPRIINPPLANGFIKDTNISKAYKYIEVHRMRENIVSLLKEKNGKTIVVTAPKDNVGNTFLTCTIGVNITFFTNMNVLLVDANLRKPEIHKHFGFDIKNGLSEIICDAVDPLSVIKNTVHPRLNIITAGKPRDDISRFLNRSIIEYLVSTVREKYDVVMFDTSPVLVNNRNNIDPSILSYLCDITMVVVLDRKTRKPDLGKTVSIIQQAGGQVDGILYNHFLPEEEIKKNLLGKLISRILSKN